MLLRDWLLFSLGCFFMIWQGFLITQFGGKYEISVFYGGMVMAGVPGILQAWALFTGRTGGESLPPAPPSSRPEPSSPTPTG